MTLSPDDIRALAVAVADELERRNHVPVGKMSKLHRDAVDLFANNGWFTQQMWRWVPRLMGIEWTEAPARWVPDAWTIELLDKRVVVIEVIVTSELWGAAKRERIRAWNRWLTEEGWKLQLWTVRPQPDGALHWCSTDPDDFLPDDLQQARFLSLLASDEESELLL